MHKNKTKTQTSKQTTKQPNKQKKNLLEISKFSFIFIYFIFGGCAVWLVFHAQIWRVECFGRS